MTVLMSPLLITLSLSPRMAACYLMIDPGPGLITTVVSPGMLAAAVVLSMCLDGLIPGKKNSTMITA